jgi:hypothetical protein
VIETMAGVALAVLAGCAVRVLLIVRPPPNGKLPHPSEVPDLPMAGPAVKAAAHKAILRKKV